MTLPSVRIAQTFCAIFVYVLHGRQYVVDSVSWFSVMQDVDLGYVSKSYWYR